jgi:hypothetical protein
MSLMLVKLVNTEKEHVWINPEMIISITDSGKDRSRVVTADGTHHYFDEPCHDLVKRIERNINLQS